MLAEFEEILEKMGMDFAYTRVQEKLPGFSEATRAEVSNKCYGGGVGFNADGTTERKLKYNAENLKGANHGRRRFNT